MPKADVNGVRLFYEVTGSGDVPLLLVHVTHAPGFAQVVRDFIRRNS